VSRPPCFEDVEAGDELPELRVTVTREQLRRFAAAANITDLRFSSDDHARKEGLPGQIVPGNMSLALLSRLVTDWARGACLRRLSATFRQVVRPASPLLVYGFVTDKRPEGDTVLVDCDLILEDEDGGILVTGTATVALPSRAA